MPKLESSPQQYEIGQVVVHRASGRRAVVIDVLDGERGTRYEVECDFIPLIDGATSSTFTVSPRVLAPAPSESP
jgi:hypothetical protein